MTYEDWQTTSTTEMRHLHFGYIHVVQNNIIHEHIIKYICVHVTVLANEVL